MSDILFKNNLLKDYKKIYTLDFLKLLKKADYIYFRSFK